LVILNRYCIFTCLYYVFTRWIWSYCFFLELSILIFGAPEHVRVFDLRLFAFQFLFFTWNFWYQIFFSFVKLLAMLHVKITFHYWSGWKLNFCCFLSEIIADCVIPRFPIFRLLAISFFHFEALYGENKFWSWNIENHINFCLFFSKLCAACW